MESRDLLLELHGLAFEVSKSFLLFCDHLGRRIVHKILVTKLAVGPLSLSLQFFELPAQALFLGIHVNNALHRHQ